jgi:hypothetical protein
MSELLTNEERRLLPLRQRFEAYAAVLTNGPQLARLEHPTHLASRANGRGKTLQYAKPTAELRKVGWYLGYKLKTQFDFGGAWWYAVKITRIGKHPLDPFDNLPMSMKPLVDGIADALEVDDANPLVRYVPHQEIGTPSVTVELYLGGRT